MLGPLQSLVEKVHQNPSWRQTHVIDEGIKIGLQISEIAKVLVVTNYYSDNTKAIARVKRHLKHDSQDRKRRRGIL